MLKKIARDLLIITGIGIMAISTSQSSMKWISEKRNDNEKWWGVHPVTQGDLVNMGYLQKVDKFLSPRDYAFEPSQYPSHKTDLIVYGDSYTFKIPGDAYSGVKNYKYGWRYNDKINYKLDSTQANVLIIEIAERYVRSFLNGTYIFDYLKKEENTTATLVSFPHKTYAALPLPDISELFNPNINQNLEYNLFNYNFINPVRHLKASLNYHLFSRASGDVVISNNRQQLFLKETVAGKRVENCYYPLQEGELQRIIETMNTLYEHYKADGFTEVYVSMIPNPSTILQPEGYNMLIPLIEHHPDLKMPIISVYDIYKNTHKKIYATGDTHWNNAGLQLWLNEVNKRLITINEQR
jgi:hypothetical protein